MEEKDININEEENLNEETVDEETAETQAEEEETTETAEEKDPLDVALDESASLKDKYLRSVAEFENYRKRTLKERAELILNGGEKAWSSSTTSC